MKKICLVSCAKKKLPTAAPAAELYTSPLFRKSRAYAEKHADDWFILSAKHGLLKPAQVIEPYDVTLINMPVAARKAWSQQTFEQIRSQINPPAELILLAGKKYTGYLVPLLEQAGYSVQEPLEGLRNGPRMRWLGQQI